jgi:KDO2-lipid IV(A) lauroyltransferase
MVQAKAVGPMIQALSLFFRSLPLGWAMAIGRFLGWVWFYLLPIRRGVALDNVHRVFGDTLSRQEQRRIVRACFAHQTMMAVESLRMPGLTAARAEVLVARVGMEHYWAARRCGRGVILAMGHLGNYEILAASQGLLGEPVHAVVRDFKSAAVSRFVARARERTGYRTIPPRRSKDQIVATLARNEIVALLVDQHMPPHRGIVCELFGMLASTSPAPARFAFQTGAVILPVVVRRDRTRPGHHTLFVEPILELETPHPTLEENIRHNTERINRILERWIRERPEEWLWMHKRWKVQDQPEGWQIPDALQHLAKSR